MTKLINTNFKIKKEKFGDLGNAEVSIFYLTNGVVDVALSNYGATIVSIHVPDNMGNKKNVVAGFSTLGQYLQGHPYFGSIVGRYANRIAAGKFYLDGVGYALTKNEGNNHLHGGEFGFNKKLWNVKNIIDEKELSGVCFSYLSKDGEEGYPGNLEVSVSYLLTADNKLQINYRATTDKPTIVNVTNHSYFNLSGFDCDNIYDHTLQVDADLYTVKNDDLIPSGELAPVKNTALDFLHAKRLGEHINTLVKDFGYDHNLVLKTTKGKPSMVATLTEPVSGRVIKVYTDQPCMQVYTANWFGGSFTGLQNKPYLKHGAIALESQAFPDAPNHASFAATTLRPGEVYETTTEYQFLTTK